MQENAPPVDDLASRARQSTLTIAPLRRVDALVETRRKRVMEASWDVRGYQESSASNLGSLRRRRIQRAHALPGRNPRRKLLGLSGRRIGSSRSWPRIWNASGPKPVRKGVRESLDPVTEMGTALYVAALQRSARGLLSPKPGKSQRIRFRTANGPFDPRREGGGAALGIPLRRSRLSPRSRPGRRCCAASAMVRPQCLPHKASCAFWRPRPTWISPRAAGRR